MDFAVRMNLHVELLSFLEARNPFIIATVKRDILASLLRASGLTAPQVVNFHVERVAEVPNLGSAAIQFIFRYVAD
jgi:hypothetical protein